MKKKFTFLKLKKLLETLFLVLFFITFSINVYGQATPILDSNSITAASPIKACGSITPIITGNAVVITNATYPVNPATSVGSCDNILYQWEYSEYGTPGTWQIISPYNSANVNFLNNITFPNTTNTTKIFYIRRVVLASCWTPSYSSAENSGVSIKYWIYPSFSVSIISQTNVLCYNNSTGTATAKVTGGAPNFTFSWNTSPVQSPSPSYIDTCKAVNLHAGIYTVNVISSIGCTTSTTATIIQPSQLIASIGSSTAPSCVTNNGTINLNVSGGTAPYTYVWTKNNVNYATTKDLTGLSNGNYAVTVTDIAGCSTTAAVTISNLPATASTISGLDTVCQRQNGVVYTVPTIANTITYFWTFPSGVTGTSSSNSITLDFSNSAVSGNITVKGNNSCGDGIPSSKTIAVNPFPSDAGTITGNPVVCRGQNNISYTVATIPNATSYIWTLPIGATGTSTTNTISVSYGPTAVSGNITVKGNNSCGYGTISTLPITINPFPDATGIVSGSATVCQGQNNVNYTVPLIANATTYVWTLPTGATGSSTTNSITVNFGVTAASGNIIVKGNNLCGDGSSSSMAIIVNPLPNAAGTITGTTTVCQGQSGLTYTVPIINNASSYVWTLPTGVIGTSTTNSITVSYGIIAVSGSITVKGSNSCGSGVASSLAITVNPLPVDAGTISGLATVCQGQSSVIYTVPSITYANSYVWTLPTGATGTSTTNSITVNYGTTAVSGNITVKGNNSCGNGTASLKAITVNPLPVAAGVISGLATVCQGQNSVIYTVPAITNATSYVWTLPTGVSGSSTTNSITVNFGTSAVAGNIVVYGNNACGNGTSSSKAIAINPLPSAAGVITGTASVCQGQNSLTYTVTAIPNATSYVWTLPTGAIGTSTTNSITVSYGLSAISGNITVCGNNSCGNGVTSNLAITVSSLPVAAGTITGTTTVCQGQSSLTYTVPAITNATSYVWILPTGASGTSSTNSITVNYSTTALSGNITVKGSNSCGFGTISTLAITVNPLPITAGTITGTTTVCQGQNNVTYTVPAINYSTSYLWTLPTGATGTSTTSSITVSYGNTAVSGNITVKGNNSCGIGNASTLAVTVNPLPIAAGLITGTTTVCQGQSSITYTVPTITNATSYVWTLPTGASGTSSTNSITVSYSASAASGNITVKGSNTCGYGVISQLPITVNVFPGNTGIISGSATVCQGQNNVIYTVPAITNATSYIWTLPTGATGTSTTNSISVNYATTAVSGNITVKGNNTCGNGGISTLAITVNPLPIAATSITGLPTVCQGQSGVTYTVPTITNATSYVWTLPIGASGTSTTNSITVNYGTTAVSSNISVNGNNSCGNGIATSLLITVNPLPIAAGSITGNSPVCQGQNGVTYSVPTITNATSYIWTLPTGASGTSSTNSITVNYSNTAISGNITVKGSNSCGFGTVSNLAISLNPLPANAGTISGSSSVCQGQNSVTYSVPAINDAISYVWTLPSGASGTSSTNTISVNFGSSAISGNITVNGNNSCGNGVASSLAITVNTLPLAAISFTGPTLVCQGQNSVVYSVPVIPNATSYLWTLPTGATGSSATNSITVNYGINAVSGNICIRGVNACGNGPSSCIVITENPLPINAGIISGLTTVCQGQNSVTYTVPVITYALNYIWTLPNDATGSSTTNSISINYGTAASNSNIQVKGNNNCGSGVASSLAISTFPLPDAAGTITGTTSVCQGQSNFTYTIPAINNATSYVWTLPLGAIGTSTTNSIIVSYGSSAVSGNITVKGNNSCGNGVASVLPITVNLATVAAGTITGSITVCQGQNNVTYTVPTITNATTYIWTLPTGATGTSTTNSISVNYATTAVSGNITVKGNNSCGNGAISTLAITVNPLPVAASSITGLSTVCQGQSGVTYTVPTITNATSYVWTLPTGASGTSSTNSITVNYETSAISGNITVKGNNSCGDGSNASLAITVNPLPIGAGTISGASTVCQGQNSVTYTVPLITNATSYIWTLPTGANGTITTNSITVSYGVSSVSGNITVKGNNSCGLGVVSSLTIVVNPLPISAGIITGTSPVCPGQSNVTYTVPAITNATSYTWTLPSGATGTSSTASITVSYGTNAVSGNITVKGSNSCGDGLVSSKAITVNPLPSAAGIISGLNTVCQGQTNVTYTVPLITNASSYVWTLPTGATGTSTTNSITVSYLTTAISGNITVKGNNSCGIGIPSTLTITVNPLPIGAGSITGFTTVCQGQNIVNYTVPSITNATSYIWTLPTGAIGTSITNSITVNYGTSALSGNITVKGSNSCGDGVISTLGITVNPLPSNAGTISGSTTVCQGQSSVIYTVPAIANALTYIWTLPSGATGTSSTNSITVNYGTSAISGNISVKGNNNCGDGNPHNLAITVNPLPANAGNINGFSAVCQGQSGVIYTVPTIAYATNYIWTLPSGATGTSSSNSITVNYGNSAFSGNIIVNGNNSCGNGTISTLAISVTPFPASAGIISGSSAVCQGDNNIIYTTTSITNATSYIWTLPSGATGLSSTNSIAVNYGTNAITGNISVKGQNSCNNGLSAFLTVLVNPLPNDAGTITGSSSVCQGQNLVSYSVPLISNASSYIWTLPTGATGTSSSNSITINYSASAISGNITVKGRNSCGDGVASNLAITVNSIPNISDDTITISSGDTFEVIPSGVPPTTTYIWPTPIYTGGVTGGSAQLTGQPSISQLLTIASGSGTATYTVTPITGNCNGNPFTIVVNVNQAICSLAVTPANHAIVSAGGSKNFNVTTTANCSWTAESNQTWCTILPASGNGNGNITVSVLQNTSGLERIANITVSTTGTTPYIVTVTQSGICAPPWTPLQNQQYTMNVITKLYLSNVLSTNHADAIGAFVGQECRGIAYPDPVSDSIFFLTITSNVQSGETVTFKSWKSGQCDECQILETTTFINQSEQGTISNPLSFHCGMVELCNSFGAGYTWFSVNINPGTMTLNSLFSNITPCENDRIIGQQAFATYYGNQWVGSLNTIDPTAMYKMKLCTQQTWCKQGLPVNIVPINISSGYPWIGYLPQSNIAINTALAGIVSNPVANDRFNGQSSFATYSGSQWVGSLLTLQKGKGYIIHLANSSVLTYPSGSLKSSSIIVTEPSVNTLSNISNCKKNARYNMQLIANIILPDGSISLNENDTVFAYVGAECRGIANPIYGLDGKLFLSVGSDVESGEIVNFKIYLSNENQVFNINNSIVFSSEMETGTMDNPYQFNLSGLKVNPVKQNIPEISFGEVYPNPFDKTASLEFKLDKPGNVEGKIINGLGSEIQVVINEELETGSYVLKINGEKLNPGIYSLLLSYSNKQNRSTFSKKIIIK
ncbi:MAG: BACON domain-containing protein [Bacteroidales bacterium]